MQAGRCPWPISARPIGRLMMQQYARSAIIPLASIQVVFFLIVAVWPLSTVGDPAFDQIIVRLKMWDALLQPYWFLGFGFCMMLVARKESMWRNRLRGVLAIALMIAAHAVLLSEESRLIEYGGLAVPRGTALNAVFIDRIICPVLALAAMWLAWPFGNVNREDEGIY